MRIRKFLVFWCWLEIRFLWRYFPDNHLWIRRHGRNNPFTLSDFAAGATFFALSSGTGIWFGLLIYIIFTFKVFY